jgi:hypothetical protein
LIKLTEIGSVPYFFKQDKTQIKTDGSSNTFEIIYDKANLDLTLKVNDQIVYEDKDMISWNVDSLMIKSDSNPEEGALLIKNLTLNANVDLKNEQYLSDGDNAVILSPDEAELTAVENVYNVKFDFIVLETTTGINLDSFSIVIGIKSLA